MSGWGALRKCIYYSSEPWLESMDQATNTAVQALRRNIEDLLSKWPAQAAAGMGRPHSISLFSLPTPSPPFAFPHPCFLRPPFGNLYCRRRNGTLPPKNHQYHARGVTKIVNLILMQRGKRFFFCFSCSATLKILIFCTPLRWNAQKKTCVLR